MRKPLFVIFAIALGVLFTSCAPAVQPYDPFVDSQLTCSELTFEITRTKELREEAQSNKGISAQNVAWAIFFWPGIFANEVSNAEAIRAADDRLRHLHRYYEEKNCGPYLGEGTAWQLTLAS